MRKFVLWNIVGVLILIFGCLGSMGIYVAVSTTESGTVAGEFLELLQARDFQKAYGLTSAVFQGSQDVASMASHYDNTGVAKIELVPWRDRTLERNLDSDMRAYITNGFGDEILTWIKMAKEDGEWRVLAMSDELRRDVGPGLWFQIIPSEEELRELTDETIAAFSTSLSSGDFTDFYNSMALAFTTGIPLKNFQLAYNFLVEDGVDISGVETARAIYDLRLPSAQLDPDDAALLGGTKTAEFQGSFHGLGLIEEFTFGGGGVGGAEASGFGERTVNVLIVSGFYPVDSGPVAFTFRYIYEHPDWKLFRVLVKKPDLNEIEPHHCIKWLLTQSNMDPSLCFEE